MKNLRAVLVAALLIGAASPVVAQSRIKDVVSVENVRDNQLIGYGLVVGLAGTGDRLRNAPFTEQSMKAMLQRMGVNVATFDMKTQNVAAVTVTATLPPFARAGSRIDVQVSALGDSTSLQGGTLLPTQLQSLAGEVFAVGQGSLAVTGISARGGGASVSRGVTTSARIANGAIIERESPFAFGSMREAKLALRNPDFATATSVAAAINAAEGAETAVAIDPSTVVVKAKASDRSMVDMMSRIEGLPIRVDQPARIVVDEASGTVVMGADVRVSKVAIAHGALTITVAETVTVSQPAPLSAGRTTVVTNTAVKVEDGQGKKLAVLDSGASLNDLVAGLNALGVSPRDLITILQSLKAAGAIQAEIEVN